MGFFTRWIGGGDSVKSAVAQPYSAQPNYSAYSMFLNPTEITAYQAWLFYKSIAPFAKAIDTIADNVASLVPIVEIDGKPRTDIGIVPFLNRPGFNRTRRRLIKEMCVQYLVTGTAYTHVIGDPLRGPLALDLFKSQFVTVFPDKDMWPASYQYSEGTRSIRFQRDDHPRDPKWLDQASGYGELIPIYDMDGNRRGVGLSRLDAIRYDVELRSKGIQHNSSLMDNGARLGGHLAFKEGMEPDQEAAVLAQFNARAAGANNTGRIMVTSGGSADFTPLSMNMKDMDFSTLIKTVEDAIVARYNIPITLFRPEAQTNNNYDTAWNMLYDQAVLPTFGVIYQGISQMFSERLGAEINIVHDALTSPVLARQASNRSRELFNAHMISRNEARQIVGYEPCLGGDTIYGPMAEVPVGEDLFNGIDGTPSTAETYHAAIGRDPLHPTVPPATEPEKPTAKRLALVT
jgi:HK97 family phage portal protein